MSTMGAKGPNHFGLEKWKKTMFRAAKQRSPVRAGRVSFLVRDAAARGLASGRPAREESCRSGYAGGRGAGTG